MAEYRIKGESLTAIADKIRILSGTEDDMSLSEMESTLGEVASSGGSNLDTCTFTFNGSGLSSWYPRYITYTTVNDSGNIVTVTEDCGTTQATVSVTCLCNSIVAVQAVGAIENRLGAAIRNCALEYVSGTIGIFSLEAIAGGEATFWNNMTSSSGGND